MPAPSHLRQVPAAASPSLGFPRSRLRARQRTATAISPSRHRPIGSRPAPPSTAPRTWTHAHGLGIGGAGCTLTVSDAAGGVTATNTLTVTRAGSDTISGAASVVLKGAYTSVTLRSNGSNAWTIVGDELTVATSCPTNQYAIASNASGNLLICGPVAYANLSGSPDRSTVRGHISHSRPMLMCRLSRLLEPGTFQVFARRRPALLRSARLVVAGRAAAERWNRLAQLRAAVAAAVVVSASLRCNSSRRV